MDKYSFNPEDAFHRIETHWKQWAKSVGAERWVIGISGGKDSTVVAALAARIFGKESVYGLMMPNAAQKDIQDSIDICRHLGIKHSLINISGAYNNVVRPLVTAMKRDFGISELSYDTTTNLPARLRMSILYAFAQTIGGIVLNTSNRSENVVSFATLYGDHAGSYAPIQDLTVTEVMALGDWMGLPYQLVHKTPIDGLQPMSDEDKLGVSYEAIDRIIRLNEGDEKTKDKVWGYFNKGKFKLQMVKIEGPRFDYRDIFREASGL